MKNIFSIIFLFIIHPALAQNIGIGTNNPLTRLQVDGSFAARAAYTNSNTTPTAAQTHTMIHTATVTLASEDSVGRIYDPGGPLGNYAPTRFGYAVVNAGGSYLECIIESINLGTGDSLILYDGADGTAPVLYRAGNNFTGNSIALSFSKNFAYCLFKSNGDASTGQGFAILFKRKYLNELISDPAAVSGSGTVFYPLKSAFRAGMLSQGMIGPGSIGLGNSTEASGSFSVATGNQTTASGLSSTAMGFLTKATGIGATASGAYTEATGNYSTASGFRSTAIQESATATGASSLASGIASTAMGSSAEATGNYSTAMGFLAKANGIASVAMGSQTEASEPTSTALGTLTQAIGYYSTALGIRTKATGVGSTSMGFNTDAQGGYSTAMGAHSISAGSYSTAMGWVTRSSGDNSLAMGKGTVARSFASFATGQFNDTLTTESDTSWQAGDRAFVIGDGVYGGNRSSCFYILKNGNGWMQGTLTQASDARLKTDIVQLRDVLPKLLRLNGYHYFWKDKQNMPGLQAGLIAQEVQKEIPELVTTNTEGQLAVNYSGMIPYLLQGLKEQQETIMEQAKAIKMQQALIDNLTVEMKSLKKKVIGKTKR